MRYLISIFLVVALVSAILIIVFTGDARAMFGFFKRYDVEMSSPVKGRLTENGNPVVGMTVYQSLSYEGYKKGEEQLRSTKTDSDGRFSFPEMIIKSRYPGDIFGQNFSVLQFVYAKRGDHLFRLWQMYKIPEMQFSKPSALLSDLMCDLQNQELSYEFESNIAGQDYPIHHVVYSICYWEDDDMKVYFDDEPVASLLDIEK